MSIVQLDCARTLKMQVEEGMEFIKPVGRQSVAEGTGEYSTVRLC